MNLKNYLKVRCSFMKTVEKTIRQHSFKIENYEELKIISERYTTVKNYVTSRYSGINSIHLIKNHRSDIRDKWLETDFAEQFKLPARYWKLALDEAISNIKSGWSNTKIRVKDSLNKNENLTDDEKHYIRYVLKSDSIFQKILQHKDFEKTDVLKKLNIREKYVHNLICRYTRRYKGSVAYSHKARSFMIDSPMYKYFIKSGQLYIEITGLKKGKRIIIKLKDMNFHSGNLRIVLQENGTLEIHRVKKVEVKNISEKEYILALDKGYTSLFATNSSKEYGEKLGEILTKETERLNGINAKRNKIWAQIEKCETEGDFKKAERIRINNFGKIKYNKNKSRYDSFVKSYINQGIYHMLDVENPTTIVCEKLDFTSWFKKMDKSQKRKLARWIKGYIQERLEYICDLRQIKVIEVNPAYTSQFCHKCGRFGIRDKKTFTCSCCGTMDADINAAHNIEQRYFDKEITLYTSYKKVKEILLNKKNDLAIS